MPTTIHRDGFTLTIAENATTGQFATGDPMVAGAVTVTAISPACTTINWRTRNGAMKNMRLQQTPAPGMNAKHGFDSAAQYTTYDASLNDALHLPITLVPGDSLVCFKSRDPDTDSSSCCAKAMVLTCVDAIPTEPMFRPAYWGPKKFPMIPVSAMDTRLLTTYFDGRDFDEVTLAEDINHLWLIPGVEWGTYLMHPFDYMPPYYREKMVKQGDMLLALNSDIPMSRKIPLAIGMVQYGIDLMGAITNGCYWDGGHGPGRKSPVVFAGIMTGAPHLLDPNSHCPVSESTPNGTKKTHEMVWGEDFTTFYVKAGSPGGYGPADVGKPEWGNFHWEHPESDNADWANGTAYRFCCWANGWIGEVLALRAMGAQKNWGHDAYFDYTDRYVQYCTANQRPDWNAGMSPEHLKAWRQFRNYDLPGSNTVGLVATGKPSLLATVPPIAGQGWTVRINAGQPGARPGLLVRSRDVLLRPVMSFQGYPTETPTFIDPGTAEGSVSFTTKPDGTAEVNMPEAAGSAGARYALQAVVLIDGKLVTTNAVQIHVMPA